MYLLLLVHGTQREQRQAGRHEAPANNKYMIIKRDLVPYLATD